MNENYNELIEDLIAHPQIEERLRAILKIAKNSSGELIRADDAERQVIVEMRKMGTAVLQDWAQWPMRETVSNSTGGSSVEKT